MSGDSDGAVPGMRLLLVVAAIFTATFYLFVRARQRNCSEHPYGLWYFAYLPRWMSGAIYSTHALELLVASANQHPNSPYRLVRWDTDITVLPQSVVEELAGLTNDVASNILALQYDMVGGWTGLSMLQDIDLQRRVVHRRMMPNVPHLTLELEDEVASAVDSLFPKTREWEEVDLHGVMLQIAARVFSRSTVGSEFCRDPRWLEFSTEFTGNVLQSLVFFRYFPPALHPLLRYIVPSVRRSIANIRQAEDLLVPVFAALIMQDDETQCNWNGTKASYTSVGSPLHWFVDLAQGTERDPVKLVHSQLLLALGSIHTSLFAELHMFQDLIARPGLVEQIRDELGKVAATGWSHTSYAELHKLDSVLRESQSKSPPFLIGLRRVLKRDHTFANGIRVRKGQYVCVPTYAALNTLPGDQSAFDGLRSYRLKEQQGDWRSAKHSFGTTESTALAFGHGRTACPGRHIASLSLKIVFAKILGDFDIESIDGSRTRPSNQYAHEIVFPSSKATIRVRRRDIASAPF